jgi:hypothetical protein
MSRSELSYTKPKIYASPKKETLKCNYEKCSKVSENKYLIYRYGSSHSAISFISGLKNKLKYKYCSTALGLKKISEAFSNEISIKHFRSILKELKLKYTEKEFKEFFKIFGKSNKTTGFSGITIESLTKCIHSSVNLNNKPPNIKPKSKASLIKTHSFSTRSSSNALEENINKLNYTLPQTTHFECFVPESNQKKAFLDSLLKIFFNPETATDYFFIGREELLTYEDFENSIKTLGIEEFLSRTYELFCSISENEKTITKNDFYKDLYDIQCPENNENNKILQDIKKKLIKTFGNCMKAFEEISNGSNYISLSMLEIVLKKLNIFIEKDQISQLFSVYIPNSKMHFKDFKEFWVGKDSICSVKTCEDSIENSCQYCKKHYSSILSRGEDIYINLHTTIKPGNLNKVFEQVLKQKTSNNIEISGTGLQKKEIRALKEFLKLKSLNKKKTSSSLKNRV